MNELYRRILWLLNRHRAERELAEEMDAHRAESEADGHRNPGFGSTLRHLETTREIWAGLGSTASFRTCDTASASSASPRPLRSRHSSSLPSVSAST